MNARLAALPVLLLPLLAACQGKTVLPPDQYDLSGTLSGDWGAKPNLRLALVGTGIPDIFTNESNYAQNVLDPVGGTRQFGLDLPSFPDIVGIYQVVAFNDQNNNARYDIGEPVGRNRKFLIYSPRAVTTPAVNVPESFPWAAGEQAIPALNVQAGWNVYDRAQPLGPNNPYQMGKITGYDIVR